LLLSLLLFNSSSESVASNDGFVAYSTSHRIESLPIYQCASSKQNPCTWSKYVAISCGTFFLPFFVASFICFFIESTHSLPISTSDLQASGLAMRRLNVSAASGATRGLPSFLIGMMTDWIGSFTFLSFPFLLTYYYYYYYFFGFGSGFFPRRAHVLGWCLTWRATWWATCPLPLATSPSSRGDRSRPS
jgi:hypothetical protein